MNTKNNQKLTLWEHVKKWEKTDLTQADYCRKNEIQYSSFSAIKSQIQKSNQKKSDFIEIPVQNVKPDKSNSKEKALFDFRLEQDFSVNIRISSEILKNISEFVNVSG